MPDQEGPTRWRVEIGIELTAPSRAEAYAAAWQLVEQRNTARAGSDVVLVMPPLLPATVYAVSGQLAAEERGEP